jgi:hypothetical protein
MPRAAHQPTPNCTARSIASSIAAIIAVAPGARRASSTETAPSRRTNVGSAAGSMIPLSTIST